MRKGKVNHDLVILVAEEEISFGHRRTLMSAYSSRGADAIFRESSASPVQTRFKWFQAKDFCSNIQ
jgi:hypothetical protein